MWYNKYRIKERKVENMRKFSVKNFMKFVGAVSMIAVLAWVGVSFLEVNMKNGSANPNYSKANAFENFYQMMVK